MKSTLIKGLRVGKTIYDFLYKGDFLVYPLWRFSHTITYTSTSSYTINLNQKYDVDYTATSDGSTHSVTIQTKNVIRSLDGNPFDNNLTSITFPDLGWEYIKTTGNFLSNATSLGEIHYSYTPSETGIAFMKNACESAGIHYWVQIYPYPDKVNTYWYWDDYSSKWILFSLDEEYTRYYRFSCDYGNSCFHLAFDTESNGEQFVSYHSYGCAEDNSSDIGDTTIYQTNSNIVILPPSDITGFNNPFYNVATNTFSNEGYAKNFNFSRFDFSKVTSLDGFFGYVSSPTNYHEKLTGYITLYSNNIAHITDTSNFISGTDFETIDLRQTHIVVNGDGFLCSNGQLTNLRLTSNTLYVDACETLLYGCPALTSTPTVKFNKNDKLLSIYEDCTGITTARIQGTAQQVELYDKNRSGAYLFTNCKNLTTLYIDNITLDYCSKTYASDGTSSYYIQNGSSFKNCANLQDIYFTNTTSDSVEQLKTMVLSGLTTETVGYQQLQNVKIHISDESYWELTNTSYTYTWSDGTEETRYKHSWTLKSA